MVLGRLDDAREAFAAALALEPRRLDAMNNIGLVLMGLRRPEEAVTSFDEVLAIDPDHLRALHNRATALADIDGSLEEALAACDKVLTLDSKHVDTLNTRGVVLGKLRRHEEALATFDAALSIVPDRLDIEANRGVALQELDRLEEALASFDKVLASDPNNIAGLVRSGNVLIKFKRYADALANYDAVLALDPDNAVASTDRGVVLTLMGRLEEALACHERALRSDPDLVGAHINRGNTLGALARLEEALACYADALALAPEHDEAHFNAAVVRLCSGDFHEGWKQYESRWKKKIKGGWPDFPQRRWDGEKDLSGKTVFLSAEQGLGDTIQFARYAPLVAALGAKVILGVQPPLRTLMATMPGVSLVISDGDPLPDFDLHCPLLSLPLAFGTDLATIPANIPYLSPYADRIAKWHERLPQSGRLRVGICWAGNREHVNDYNRSMPLERLAKIFSVSGLDFVCLQRDLSEAQAVILREHRVLQIADEFADFADTAAVVAMLDLVVAVDTSVAHLAGAMGKAVALLVPFSPDWRWLLDRTDSPWYPTMRLFRQTAPGDWDGVIERLRRELIDLGCRPARPQ